MGTTNGDLSWAGETPWLYFVRLSKVPCCIILQVWIQYSPSVGQ